MKKALVTGANGFIGSALLNILSENGIEIIAVLRNRDKSMLEFNKIEGVRIVYCELENIDKLPELLSDRDIDVCIHLAWAGSTGVNRSDYSLQLSNVKYTCDLVHAINKMDIKRFVGAGTLAEKDVLAYQPTDGAIPNTVSNYGTAKIATHFMTKAECSRLGVEHIWCYLSNTYGVGNRTSNFINFASKLMLNGERAAFTAGEQTYDFVYITDTVRAIFAAADKGLNNTAYYLGSNKQRKLKDYIEIIKDIINPAIELHLGEVPFLGVPLEPDEFNCSKLIEDTGYEPLVPFEEGIRKTIDWLKSDICKE